MKNITSAYLLILGCSFSLYAQPEKIKYTLPQKVNEVFLLEIKNDANFYDTSIYYLSIYMRQNKDTIECSLIRTLKKEPSNKRSISPIINASNRVVYLNEKFILPVFFPSDLAFSQWPMGLHGSFYCAKFSLSGKFYTAAFE